MSSEYLNKLFSLEGQVVVVIGGTGVLGGALCEGLAQAGAHVVVAGRSEARGPATRRGDRKARRRGLVCRGRRQLAKVDSRLARRRRQPNTVGFTR